MNRKRSLHIGIAVMFGALAVGWAISQHYMQAALWGALSAGWLVKTCLQWKKLDA